MFNIHSIGDALLHAGFVVSAFALIASLVGKLRKDGRLLLAGERAGYVVAGLMVTASFLLIHAFLNHDYQNKYVASYSDNSMPWYYLIASFWGGQQGSLLFWSVTLSVITAISLWQNRAKNRDLMPTVISLMMGVQLFFLALMIWEANPFAQYGIEAPPSDGKGLEPLLQNPAMTFHPPSILSGYVWFTVPFAFAIAALIHRRLDDLWIRTTRRYAVISWGFLTMGNLFGGMWAYQELGWGGFWGWDPVENAAFMPWLSGTAFLHSVMIQERRGMLKVWNMYLVLLTYALTIFGTALTRAGFIDSVHTFAQSDIGTYFVIGLIVLFTAIIALLNWRIVDGSLLTLTTSKSRKKAEASIKPAGKGMWGAFWLFHGGVLAALFYAYSVGGITGGQIGVLGPILLFISPIFFWLGRVLIVDPEARERGRIESLLSREGVFLLNNLVLMGMVVIVLFGTVGEKVSEYFWRETKYSAPWFNAWMVPAGIALLLLMSIGPLIPWRKATMSNFRRNFLMPLVVCGAATAAFVAGDAYNIQTHLSRTDLMPDDVFNLPTLLKDAELTGIYALISMLGIFFVVYTMVWEFIRGAAVRARSTGERYVTSMGRLAGKQRRRYGGYITHIGFGLVFAGFVGTGLKTEKDLSFAQIGESQILEGKRLLFRGIKDQGFKEYQEYYAVFDVFDESKIQDWVAGGGSVALLTDMMRKLPDLDAWQAAARLVGPEQEATLGQLYNGAVSLEWLQAQEGPVMRWLLADGPEPVAGASRQSDLKWLQANKGFVKSWAEQGPQGLEMLIAVAQSRIQPAWMRENGAAVAALADARDGTLRPAQRIYGSDVKRRFEGRTTTEKDELHELTGNTYLTLISYRPAFQTAEIMAHYNPMIFWMWIGGAMLLLGVVFAVWPETEAYPVFAAARRKARVKKPGAAKAPAMARTGGPGA